MAKDPAFLFYTQDFTMGTTLMSYEQKGKYITLLCLQHQTGHLSYDDMISVCISYDDRIFSKFIKDSDGLFYNERLENESIKRRNYCESRGRNRKSGLESVSYDSHMEIENENTFFKVPTIIQVREYFKEKGYTENSANRAYEYYNLLGWKDKNGKPIKNWKLKMNNVWFKQENLIPSDKPKFTI